MGAREDFEQARVHVPAPSKAHIMAPECRQRPLLAWRDASPRIVPPPDHATDLQHSELLMATPSTVATPTQGPTSARSLKISLAIPVYNEAESLDELYQGITGALQELDEPWEVVFVDDGSTDGSFEKLSAFAATDPRVRVVRLRRNFGQTAAMAAAFDHANGEVIIGLDSDLQNDPADIPMLLAKLDEGYDVVSGWRKDRQDNAALRRFPSRIANWLIGRVTGVRLHDYGCSLKAYRADVIRDLRLYGEMHRFIPALAYQLGARIIEVPVRHHPRRYGTSKYGLKRTFKVLLDLLTVKFFSSYGTKPIYVFGGTGTILALVGSGAAALTLYQKYVDGVYVYRNPMFIVGIFLFSLGINLILMGLLAESIVRTYHESQSKPIYWVRETRNLAADES
jgi:glycosyltransferase involved in cell wall biosynthesis